MDYLIASFRVWSLKFTSAVNSSYCVQYEKDGDTSVFTLAECRLENWLKIERPNVIHFWNLFFVGIERRIEAHKWVQQNVTHTHDTRHFNAQEKVQILEKKFLLLGCDRAPAEAYLNRQFCTEKIESRENSSLTWLRNKMERRRKICTKKINK